MGLNLALVLDVSGSMYEEDGTGISRLKRIQDAAIRCHPEAQARRHPGHRGFRPQRRDVVAAHQALRKGQDRGRHPAHRHVRRRSGRHRHGRGHEARHWTRSKSKPAAAACPKSWCSPTAKPPASRIAASWPRKPPSKKIHLTLMGVGIDWKASLIKDLAKLSEGKWYYIDVNQKEEAERIFVRGIRAAGGDGVQERRNAPAADEGHQDQARPPGGARDQGSSTWPSRKNATWSPSWARCRTTRPPATCWT